jgi:hypothetical protein
MHRQLAAGDLFLDAKPSLIGQSKTDRVRVIGNALSHALYSSVVLDSAFVNANRMFAFANGKPRSTSIRASRRSKL